MQRVDVLRDQGALIGGIRPRGLERLLGLGQISARRDPAIDARAGEAHALLGDLGGLLGEREQRFVGAILQPGGGNIADEGEPRRVGTGFGREIAVLLGAAERGEAAEQVDLE